MKTIAVDFDGVLHSYEKGWHDGTIYGDWLPDAATGLIRLQQNFAVFVHTSRSPRTVARWIEQKSGYAFECTTHVPRSGFWNRQDLILVTNRKLPAVAYIDDRGLHFESWEQTLRALEIQ